MRKALDRLKEKRELLKRERKRHEIPTVAVVGYTNSGIEFMFPHGLENLEKWENVFQSGNFEQTGRVKNFTQNNGKMVEFNQILKM